MHTKKKSKRKKGERRPAPATQERNMGNDKKRKGRGGDKHQEFTYEPPARRHSEPRTIPEKPPRQKRTDKKRGDK